jgi:hypothetical protein
MSPHLAGSQSPHKLILEHITVTSSFTWFDYSEHERRKMMDVISQFREKDTRDELGMAVPERHLKAVTR